MISAFRYGLKFTLGAILVFMICYQLNRLRTLADIRSQDLSIGGLRPGLSLQEMQAIRGPCKPVSGPGLERIEPFVIYDFPEDDCRVYLREGHISHILGYTLDVKGTRRLKEGGSAKVLKRLRAEVRIERLHKHEIRYWYPSLGLIVEVDGYSRIKAFELGFPEPVGSPPKSD